MSDSHIIKLIQGGGRCENIQQADHLQAQSAKNTNKDHLGLLVHVLYCSKILLHNLTGKSRITTA